MAKKKPLHEQCDDLFADQRALLAKLNEVCAQVGVEPLRLVDRSADNAPLSPAELQTEAAHSQLPNGGKGETAVQKPLLPLLDLKPTEGHGVNGRSTAVSQAPENAPMLERKTRTWEAIADVLRMKTQNLLATNKRDTREKRKDTAVRYIFKHGCEILPDPTTRQRNWITGAALFADKNSRTITNCLKYMLHAIESARAGGEPCPDDYFREADECFLDHEALSAAPRRGSMADVVAKIEMEARRDSR